MHKPMRYQKLKAGKENAEAIKRKKFEYYFD